MGDHFKEGAPMFFKGWAFFLGVAATFGLVTYIMRPLRSEPTANWNHWNYIYDLYKKRADEKYFYNWGKQNPFGIGNKEVMQRCIQIRSPLSHIKKWT